MNDNYLEFCLSVISILYRHFLMFSVYNSNTVKILHLHLTGLSKRARRSVKYKNDNSYLFVFQLSPFYIGSFSFQSLTRKPFEMFERY